MEESKRNEEQQEAVLNPIGVNPMTRRRKKGNVVIPKSPKSNNNTRSQRNRNRDEAARKALTRFKHAGVDLQRQRKRSGSKSSQESSENAPSESEGNTESNSLERLKEKYKIKKESVYEDINALEKHLYFNDISIEEARTIYKTYSDESNELLSSIEKLKKLIETLKTKVPSTDTDFLRELSTTERYINAQQSIIGMNLNTQRTSMQRREQSEVTRKMIESSKKERNERLSRDLARITGTASTQKPSQGLEDLNEYDMQSWESAGKVAPSGEGTGQVTPSGEVKVDAEETIQFKSQEDIASLLLDTPSQLEARMKKLEEKITGIQSKQVGILRSMLDKKDAISKDTPLKDIRDSLLKEFYEKNIPEIKTRRREEIQTKLDTDSTLSKSEKKKLTDELTTIKTQLSTLKDSINEEAEVAKTRKILGFSTLPLKRETYIRDHYLQIFNTGDSQVQYPKIDIINAKTPFEKILVEIKSKTIDNNDEGKAYAELYAKIFVYMYLLSYAQKREKLSLGKFVDLFKDSQDTLDFSTIFTDKNISKLSSIIEKLDSIEPLIEEAYFRIKPKGEGNLEYKEQLIDSKEFLKKLPQLREIL